MHTLAYITVALCLSVAVAIVDIPRLEVRELW